MKRLYGLDALRGVAALAVVIWHWQHFYDISGVWLKGWHYEAEPFFQMLWPLYLQGWAAVDIFFALSGYVFFWLYAEKVAAGKIPATAFAWKRLSRLYPLHILSLLLVVVLQAAFHARTGGHFVFPADSWQRFGASLLLAQQWLPPTIEQTFNGPAWTVSVEAGLYVLFFVLCRRGLCGPKTALSVAAVGVALYPWNECIARGMVGFFLGGVCFFIVRWVMARKDAARWAWGCIWLTLLLWLATLTEVGRHPLYIWAEALTDYLGADDFYAEYSSGIFHQLYVFTVVPASIIALALHESVLNSGRIGGLYRFLSRFGDISYATYMLHFPLQIVVALIVLHSGLGTSVFEHDLTLIAFYVVLIALGALVWRYFELPVQQCLRQFHK